MADQFILLDLDGTLTDPREGITGCIRYAMDRMGTPLSPETDLDWCIGPPLKSSFEELLGHPGGGAAEQALTLYRERFTDIGLLENEVYPDIPEVLVRLQSDGYRLLMATSKPQVYAHRIAEHFRLSHFFERIYGSELDGRLADKSDLLRAILTTEGMAADDCVMIGDRRHDIEGARANGISAIAVTWGYGTEAEIATAAPAAVCHSPTALLPLVREFRPI